MPGGVRGGGDCGGRVDPPEALERAGSPCHLGASRTPAESAPSSHRGHHHADVTALDRSARPAAASAPSRRRLGAGTLTSDSVVMRTLPAVFTMRGGDRTENHDTTAKERSSRRPRILRRIVALTHSCARIATCRGHLRGPHERSLSRGRVVPGPTFSGPGPALIQRTRPPGARASRSSRADRGW